MLQYVNGYMETRERQSQMRGRKKERENEGERKTNIQMKESECVSLRVYERVRESDR